MQMGHKSKNPNPHQARASLLTGSQEPVPNENICNYDDNIMILKGIRFC